MAAIFTLPVVALFDDDAAVSALDADADDAPADWSVVFVVLNRIVDGLPDGPPITTVGILLGSIKSDGCVISIFVKPF